MESLGYNVRVALGSRIRTRDVLDSEHLFGIVVAMDYPQCVIILDKPALRESLESNLAYLKRHVTDCVFLELLPVESLLAHSNVIVREVGLLMYRKLKHDDP